MTSTSIISNLAISMARSSENQEIVSIDDYLERVDAFLAKLTENHDAISISGYVPFFGFPVPSCLSMHPEQLEYIGNHFRNRRWIFQFVQRQKGDGQQTILLIENTSTNFPLKYDR